MAGLDRLEDRRLPELVAERIVSFIAANRLEAGARLPTELDLSRMLGVGRSSVREALRALEFLGVVTRSTEGTFVRSTGPDLLIAPLRYVSMLLPTDGDEWFEFRRVLEVEMAGLAAEQATEQDIAELERLVEQMETTTDPNAYVQANVDFHMRIAHSAGNRLLLGVYLSFRQLVARLQLNMLRTNPQINPERIAEHRAILRAVAESDAQKAREAMVRHLASVAEEVRAGAGVGGSRSRTDDPLIGEGRGGRRKVSRDT